MSSRKRIRKRDKAIKEGIPVAKLGKEFEWIDEKLRVGLEAYPTFKRPLGKAEISMMLALNMYYDDITKKWKVMDSLDISTVKNLGRFYLSDPPALTTDVFEYMRIDKNHRLEVIDSVLNIALTPDILELTIPENDFRAVYLESSDYPYDNLTVLIYDLAGADNDITVSYYFPDTTTEIIHDYVNLAAAAFDFYKLKPWNKIHFTIATGAGCGFKLYVQGSKKPKYFP